MAPTDSFWSMLILAGVASVIMLTAGIALFLKIFVFKVAEERTGQFARGKNKNELDDFTPMERGEVVSLLRQLGEQDELATAEDRRQSFFDRLERDIKGPINSILGYCDVISEESQEAPTKQNTLKIRRATKHLLRIMDDVLDISRIQSGKLRSNQERTDLKLLINDVIKNIRPLAESRSNKIDVDLPQDLGMVLCDGTKIRQILKNLLTNACKFTSEDTIKVRVEVEYQGDHDLLYMIVEDHGIGIAEADVDRIFTMFERLDSDGIPGTGLGLPISRSLARFMGGDVTVKSTPGEGTVFSASAIVKSKNILG